MNGKDWLTLLLIWGVYLLGRPALAQNWSWSLDGMGGVQLESREENLPAVTQNGQGYERLPSSENYLQAGLGGSLIVPLISHVVWFGGYRYQHYWYSNSQRIQGYLEDPEDLGGLPYRTDLLERQHELSTGIFREGILDSLTLGISGTGALARTSSSWVPAEDSRGLRPRSLFLEETFSLKPWAMWAWTDTQLTRFAWLISETKNHDSEFSHKTQNQWHSPSFKLQHFYDLPAYGFEGVAQIHWLKWIYNDPWQDQRDFTLANELTFHHGPWALWVDLGLSFKDFPQHTVRFSRKCDGALGEPSSEGPQFCHREDTLSKVDLGVWWSFWESARMSLAYQWKENSSTLKEYHQIQTNIILGTKIIFGDTRMPPSLKGVYDGKKSF